MRRLLAIAAAVGIAAPVCADDLSPRMAPPPSYSVECGACHVAYPPALLPATSWQRLIGGLGSHFGTDASIDAAAAREISAWLVANAGSGRKLRRETAPPADDRITRSAWFVREHHEVAAAVWRRPAVGSPSNCGACHGGAAQGRFSGHDISIPR